MRFIAPDKIFTGTEFLKGSDIAVFEDDGTFVEFVNVSKIDPTKVEMTGGTLTPGFINAHCHLELSHLHNAVPQQTGLIEFAKGIISTRNKASLETQMEAQVNADKYMRSRGIVAVGDICNTNSSFQLKSASKITYHSFIELIGLDPKRKNDILHYGNILLNEAMNLGIRASFAPHAPYSTSTELIAAISEHDHIRSMPFSIHNQESAEEDKFMSGTQSQFSDLYKFLNLDISWFTPIFKSSLESYKNFLQSKHNILVHNTYTTEEDLALSNSTLFWCTCPRANLYIEGKLPDYATMLKYTQQICFGTDSLASNLDLDLLKDANCFYKETNELTLTLKGLTSIAANALNYGDSFGSFMKGKRTGANIIEIGKNELILKQTLFC